MLKDLIFNESGRVSKTKIGAVLTSVSMFAFVIPSLDLQVITIPPAFYDICKIIGAIGAFIGGSTTVAGFRDAIGKK